MKVQSRSVRWNDEVKAAIKKQKKDVWKLTEKKRERLKGVYIRAKKKVNEQFERKMNEDENRNRKMFWKDVSSAKE